MTQNSSQIKGSTRRLFLARAVQALGEGGQRLAERELGWNRGTILEGHLLLATLAQRLTFEFVGSGPIEPEPLLTLRPKGTVLMRVRRLRVRRR